MRQIMRPRGKRLTPAQEQYLSARYADRLPAGDVAPTLPGDVTPAGPVTDTRSRSNSADSEKIAEVLYDLGVPKASHSETSETQRTECISKRYRSPDRKLSADVPEGVDAVLAEVLQQLDEEDKEASHGDSDDNDYTDESPAQAQSRDRLTRVKVASRNKQSKPQTRPKKYRKTNSGRIPSVNENDSQESSNCASETGTKQLLEGLPLVWPSWKEFTTAFTDFQESTFQQFVARTSTSVATRNSQIKAAQDRAARKSTTKKAGDRSHDLRLENVATGVVGCLQQDVSLHGMPYEAKGTGKRSHTKVRATGCSARVNARVKLRGGGGADFHLVVKATGTHNHRLSPHTWYNYASNRRIQDEGLRQEVAVMSRAGAKPKGILAYLRAKTGKVVVICGCFDVEAHETVSITQKRFDPGSTGGERALKVLDEFCEGSPGNTAQFLVDSGSGVVRVVTFQSARMRRLFAVFPEVVLVYSTHNTNSNRYKLFSFAIHCSVGYATDTENEHNFYQNVNLSLVSFWCAGAIRAACVGDYRRQVKPCYNSVHL
ncbi:LOW QUALITY PROTEIN: hypothetical protein PHMEG_00034189 [Phytophthora megakarya]|uniref:ZSWIM1/3 RNaseH-like domain-containing protein n=1 Tax=Phytophthora megakarya TaxID=4795 RepID=A0A225US28_9STRA|nr:LOW QUALITY PROTEIN: hypothetical protein PHMEG_00034189 [Phytophthora megakarya]